MAANNYKTRIRSYCQKRGYQIPAGFERQSASRYAVVRLDIAPPKLIARTWFKQEDMAYFLKTVLSEELGEQLNAMTLILDFKDERRFHFINDRLRFIETFDPAG